MTPALVSWDRKGGFQGGPLGRLAHGPIGLKDPGLKDPGLMDPGPMGPGPRGPRSCLLGDKALP